MIYLDWDKVHQFANFKVLAEEILQMFANGCECLDRLTLAQPTKDGTSADCLIQPGWMPGKAFGVKIANVFYDNSARGLPTVMGSYVLFDGNTGAPLAYIDGLSETFVKTAANSAAASKTLSRPESQTLLMIGAGKLAPYLIKAHAAVRPIRTVLIANRTRSSAETLAKSLKLENVEVNVVDDVANAAYDADIISCATYAASPVLRGEWIRQGCHVDLVGGYRPDQREADDEVIIRGGRQIFVDARQTTVDVAGDVIQPIESGALRREDVVDMFEVVQSRKPGRRTEEDITVFKSGGGGHEDLAVALSLYRQAGGLLEADLA
jgi:ornithine cyclodeaminase